MVIRNIYARKSVYGGIHIITEDDNFYPVGTIFSLIKQNTNDNKKINLGSFVVKKVSIKEDEKGQVNKSNVLEYQMVDNGESSISKMNYDIREFLPNVAARYELEEYVAPVIVENDNQNNEDNNKNEFEKPEEDEECYCDDSGDCDCSNCNNKFSL